LLDEQLVDYFTDIAARANGEVAEVTMDKRLALMLE